MMMPRWGIVPRAKPRGTYTHHNLVSASLDEQFMRIAEDLHSERSRGAYPFITLKNFLFPALIILGEERSIV